MSHQLPPAIDNLPQNLVVNHNLLNMAPAVEVSQPSYDASAHLTANSQNILLSQGVQQSCSRNSAMTAISNPISDNVQSNPLYNSNCLVPQNLSLAANTMVSQNVSSNILTDSVSLPNRNKLSLPAQRYSNTLIGCGYHSEFPNPQNLSNHASFENSLSSSRLPLVQDLSMHQTHDPNLNELSVTMTEEVLKPQNLSQSHSCQPENLTMPQNLSATSNNARRSHCFNQPKSTSIHTPLQLDLMPQKSSLWWSI